VARCAMKQPELPTTSHIAIASIVDAPAEHHLSLGHRFGDPSFASRRVSLEMFPGPDASGSSAQRAAHR
jgi:hypothetical protein